MDYEEFLKWMDYFDRRPVGWRDDLRTHMLMQAWGTKEPAHKVFASLKRMHELEHVVNAEGTDMQSLKGSYLYQKMLTAVGGDKLDL
jgi:hypothetical protein